ncbi:hypothetical protein GJ689_02720 [Rhodoplanes serenus]|uniref:SGNH hydrolase-type esterase domain-containing protein n=1 Tax=Rhodoplanes serenus TaxID=200615 RepID=A0A9X4XMA0_9BRAD|nr:hypothetical protein [Rhodoplanes serenus]MTW15116.1 hypothetical protein [Rhodoplanes serenus]
MTRRVASAAVVTLALAASPAAAADLLWEVENPFRFFKRTSAFDLHERAYKAVRGAAEDPVPGNIVWRTERRLNDPDCRDASSPAACAATAGRNYERSRLGWAAQTLDVNCYDRNARPRRYLVTCDRQYSWGTAKEDTILPDAHTVIVRLAPQHLASAAGDCTWTWRPRRGGAGETVRQSCAVPLVIKRVPFSTQRAASGVAVAVRLPDGRELVDSHIVVEDVLIVAMGDSFASGESNPDRPVVFSAGREMVYDPVNTRDEVATRSMRGAPTYGIASAPEVVNPKSLPKRLMEDEERGLIYRPSSAEFQAAFDKRGAQWLSADCHRSQYGYPFRVGLQLALENRHRAVSFVSLACSGSDTVEGLFGPREPREQTTGPNAQRVVVPQLDQLTELICRPGAPRARDAVYTLPTYAHGSTSIGQQTFTKFWCPPESRKRPIDLVLLSIGGNDVGFGALVAYGITESAADLAPIAGLVGRQLRFEPHVARVYLDVLDRRMKALKDALVDGFGVDPSTVLHNAYEPVQFDETGRVCGMQPTIGLDVHPKLHYGSARVQEVSDFTRDLQARMECMADARRRPGCPRLATGSGTGFRFVAEHTAMFARRGVCARDPQRTLADQINMMMPRLSQRIDEFQPYSPAVALPYGKRWRLIHSPNDAFLTANTHREGISPFDILQPAYAALYSGAFHPTAEGHAIVADAVVRHARDILDRRAIVDVR